MEHENAADFVDGLRVLVCGVTGGHDELGLRAIHVRTPVRHDTVAGVWCIAFASVPHDGVIGDAGCNRDRVDRFHEAVVWGERVHAIRHPFELQVARVKGGDFNDGIARAK